jgi:hypothetical protein
VTPNAPHQETNTNKKVDKKRLDRACQLLREHTQKKDHPKWARVMKALDELGWSEEVQVADACLDAPIDWLEKTGRGLRVQTDTGKTYEAKGPDEMALLERTVQALSIFEGSELVQIRKWANIAFEKDG